MNTVSCLFKVRLGCEIKCAKSRVTHHPVMAKHSRTRSSMQWQMTKRRQRIPNEMRHYLCKSVEQRAADAIRVILHTPRPHHQKHRVPLDPASRTNRFII